MSIAVPYASLLERLGLRSARGLMNYQPIIAARSVVRLSREGASSAEALAPFIDARRAAAAKARHPSDFPIEVLHGMSVRDAETLKEAGILTLADLAGLPDALSDLLDSAFPANGFSEPPSAPAELLPEMAGGGHVNKRFTSWVVDRDLRDLGLQVDIDCLPADLIAPSPRGQIGPGPLATTLITSDKLPCPVLRLGYMAGYQQSWHALGTALGEVVHTLSLAPGESRNVAVVDWTRRSQAARKEATEAGETLRNREQHHRALDEVAQAVAEEQQFGRTSAMAGSMVTAGSFVMAGAAVGGIAGGLIGTAVEPGGGTAIGAAVGAGAGVAAGSLLFSGATALGVIESESAGERDVMGETSQRIQQSTAQQASFVRSLRSAVVVTDEQSESQNLMSSNVTNYNHMHALNITYFEVLQRYLVHTGPFEMRPLLVLPFAPILFDGDTADRYWTSLRVSFDGDMRTWGDALFLAPALKQPVPTPVPATPDAPEPKLSDLKVSNAMLTVTLDFPITLAELLINDVTQLASLFSLVETSLETQGGQRHGLKDVSNIAQIAQNLILSGRQVTMSFGLPAGASISGDLRGIFVRLIHRESFTDAASDMFEKLTGLETGVTVNAKVEVDNMIVSGPSFLETHANRTLPMHPLDREDNIFTGLFDFDPVTALRAEWHAYDTEVADIAQIEADNAAADHAYQTSIAMRDDWRDQIVDHLNRHRYAFTRQIFTLAAGPAITRLLDAIQIRSGAGDGATVPLHEIADTRPLGFTDGAIVLWLKQDLARDSALLTGFKDLVAKYGADAVASLGTLIKHHAVIAKKFADAKEKAGKAGLVYLPSSGVFAESILGRANGAEYVVPDRYWNWQDSPIPHQAPAISPLSLQSGFQTPSGLDPNVQAPHLQPAGAPSFPAATGLQNILAAVRDGNMFRDMSKSDQLVSTMSSLNELAGEMGKASAELTGDAAEQALKASVQIGEAAAKLAQQLHSQSMRQVADPPKNPTEKAASTKAVTDAIKEGSKNEDEGVGKKTAAATGDGEGIPVAEDDGGSGSGGTSGSGSGPGSAPPTTGGSGDPSPPPVQPFDPSPDSGAPDGPHSDSPDGDETPPVFTPGDISARGREALQLIADELDENGADYDRDKVTQELRRWFDEAVGLRIGQAIDDPGPRTNDAAREFVTWYDAVAQLGLETTDALSARYSLARERLTKAYDGNLEKTNEKLKNSSSILSDLETLSKDYAEALQLGLDPEFSIADLNISVQIDPVDVPQDGIFPQNKVDLTVGAALVRADGTKQRDHTFDVEIRSFEMAGQTVLAGQTRADAPFAAQVEFAPFVGKAEAWQTGDLNNLVLTVNVGLAGSNLVTATTEVVVKGGLTLLSLGGWNTAHDEPAFEISPSAANGQDVVMQYQLARGRHFKTGARVHFELEGAGSLNLSQAMSGENGIVQVIYSPPDDLTGAASITATWTEDGMETLSLDEISLES
ncbi:hypothetical protein KX928_19600 [Roseobacter sp. YSTF-M11]|uniref:Uncharacterized protein n=1 Tax=Roseobacter insulae TaxID=2859783 RepID=A0A9X1K079_9RHOB|nr:hypothetical protein [Roseobacter insulae]MBW4709995.1 hypothetical protein [Roseobacter insulae]